MAAHRGSVGRDRLFRRSPGDSPRAVIPRSGMHVAPRWGAARKMSDFTVRLDAAVEGTAKVCDVIYRHTLPHEDRTSAFALEIYAVRCPNFPSVI